MEERFEEMREKEMLDTFFIATLFHRAYNHESKKFEDVALPQIAQICFDSTNLDLYEEIWSLVENKVRGEQNLWW